MSSDLDTARTVRAWLEHGVTVLPDHVLDSVLDQLPATHQRRATWWPARRSILMSTPLRWGAAAVVVVALALIGISYFNSRGVGISPTSPSPSASPSGPLRPTASPTPSPVVSGSLPNGGSITQGSYTVADPFPVGIGLELPSGWTMWGGGVASDTVAMYEGSPDPPAGHGIIFVIVNNTYADGCDPSAGAMTPKVGPTVDDLAAAITAQVATVSTAPAPVTIDGYDGVYLDYRNDGTGACGTVVRWPTTTGGDRVALAGERDQVWILDVDGQRLVIDAFSFGDTTTADRDELRQIVEALDLNPSAGS